MPDAEEQERSEESTGEEGRPLAITHGNQVLTLLCLKYRFIHSTAIAIAIAILTVERLLCKLLVLVISLEARASFHFLDVMSPQGFTFGKTNRDFIAATSPLCIFHPNQGPTYAFYLCGNLPTGINLSATLILSQRDRPL